MTVGVTVAGLCITAALEGRCAPAGLWLPFV
jgi:hypothetical protein